MQGGIGSFPFNFLTLLIQAFLIRKVKKYRFVIYTIWVLTYSISLRRAGGFLKHSYFLLDQLICSSPSFLFWSGFLTHENVKPK